MPPGDGSPTPRERARSIRRGTRSLLPIVEYGTCSGVDVPAPAEPRRLFDRLRPGRETPERSTFEGALVTAHREWTEPTDDVVIVGGGYGITTTVAARHGRAVTVYEPSSQRRSVLRRTLALNGVAGDDVSIRAESVGAVVPAAGRENGVPQTAPSVTPASLPACDVLELDCEGAEREVLEGVERDRRPSVLAVEIHPIKLDGATEAVLDAILALDYRIRQRYTHDGAPIHAEAFQALLAGETLDDRDPDHQEYPPVAIATLDT